MKSMREKNVLTEFEVKYKVKKRFHELEAITTAKKAFEYLYPSFDKDTIGCQEQFNVLYVNRGNTPLGIYKVSKGSITGTIADVRLVLAMALKTMATGIILAHNHPSGKPMPSNCDITLTRKFQKACAYMDIELMDHLIVTPLGGMYSLADHGKL